jgi:hypothetical protein
MSHRTLAGLIIALVASSGQSPVQPSALAEAARPGAVAVQVLVSASPGTQTPDGDWCIGDAPAITLTPQVLTLASPQSEVTEGTIVWQVCLHNQQSLPKEDCDGHGPGRWENSVMTFLSGPAPSSITTFQQVQVRGWRVQFQPTAGSGYKSEMSASFNLDRTCLP